MKNVNGFKRLVRLLISTILHVKTLWLERGLDYGANFMDTVLVKIIPLYEHSIIVCNL